MSVVIFSDSHLPHHFEEKKYHFLRQIISQVDTVIINGDFWDGYVTSFDSFITSEWTRLFPLLKAKQTIYLYGNHDNANFADNRVSLFCDQALFSYNFSFNKMKFVVEHGNRFLPTLDERLRIREPYPFLAGTYRQIARTMVRTFKHKFINFYYRPDNQKIKEKISQEFLQEEILICGHTHAAELNLEQRYLNSGIVNYGLGQYLLFDNKKIQFCEQWYE
jgi:predicted phosphodiesterase